MIKSKAILKSIESSLKGECPLCNGFKKTNNISNNVLILVFVLIIMIVIIITITIQLIVIIIIIIIIIMASRAATQAAGGWKIGWVLAVHRPRDTRPPRREV